MRNPKFRKVLTQLRLLSRQADASIGAAVWAGLCRVVFEIDTNDEQSAQRYQAAYRWIISRSLTY